MIPIGVPEAERRGAEVAERICRRVLSVEYTDGEIDRAKVGFNGKGEVVRCRIFAPDGWEYGHAQLPYREPDSSVEWIDLHYDADEGWHLPHD